MSERAEDEYVVAATPDEEVVAAGVLGIVESVTEEDQIVSAAPPRRLPPE